MLPDPIDQPQFYDGVNTKRALAWVVDCIVIITICLLILPFTAFTGLFFFPMMMLVVGFIYRIATLAAGSATWGMRLLGIELRDNQDRPFDGATAIMHTLGYAVSVAVAPLQLISIVLMAATERRQGLTDHILGSVAINRRRLP